MPECAEHAGKAPARSSTIKTGNKEDFAAAMMYSLLAIVIWASSFVAGKYSYTVADPVLTVQFRLVVAALIVAPTFGECYRAVPVHLRRRLWLLAFMNFPLVYLLQFIGLNYTSAASAATIIGAEPVLSTLIGYLFFKQRTHLLNWLSAVAAFAGIGLIVLGGERGGEISLFGSLLVLGAGISFVFCLYLGRDIMQSISAKTYTVTTLVLGALFCLPFTFLLTQNWHITPNAGGVFALFYLAIACSWLAILLWNKGLRAIPASVSGILIALEPVLGVLFAIVILGESPSSITACGMLLTMTATAVCVWYGQRR